MLRSELEGPIAADQQQSIKLGQHRVTKSYNSIKLIDGTREYNEENDDDNNRDGNHGDNNKEVSIMLDDDDNDDDFEAHKLFLACARFDPALEDHGDEFFHLMITMMIVLVMN